MTDNKNIKKNTLKDGNGRVTMSMPIKQIERMDKHADDLGISRNAFMQIAIAEYMLNREFAHGGMIEAVKQSLIDEINKKLDNQ